MNTRLLPALASLRRFGRYLLVGVGTFSIDLLLLYLLTQNAHVPLFISTPVSFLIAVSINYFISRQYAFRGTKRALAEGYLYFGVVAAIGAFCTTLLVTFLTTHLGLYFLLARILVAGLVGLANYVVNLYLNFRMAGAPLS